MRTNQDREVLPQGIAPFDSSGIDEAVKLIAAAGRLSQFLGGLLSAGTVFATLTHVFSASPQLSKLQAMSPQKVVDDLRALMPVQATELQVILALQRFISKL